MSTSIAKAFRTLELDGDASFGEVKQAYRLLVKVWHPDRFTDDIDLQKAAETKLKEVNLVTVHSLGAQRSERLIEIN